MRTYLIVAVLLLFSWLGAFGIAFGVSEWRYREDDNAALIAQAEACRSAVLWWNTVKTVSFPEFHASAVAMSELCGKLSGIDEP